METCASNTLRANGIDAGDLHNERMKSDREPTESRVTVQMPPHSAINALDASWSRAWTAIEASAPQSMMFQLLDCYCEPHRHYHTLQHLQECLSALEPALSLATHAGEVELALWFHDAIYNPKAHDNELRSAEWAAQTLLARGTPAGVARRVHTLILASAHASPPQGPDAQLLVDVDLSILGTAEPRFSEYHAQVRAEYQWVPEPTYLSKRRDVLQGFLDRSPIFNTQYFRARLEMNARRNLTSALAQVATAVDSPPESYPPDRTPP